MQIVRYTPDKQQEWDEFVSSSKNGTFILYRNYIDYHKNKLKDYSFMFYHHNRLIALLPGNISGTTFFSHQGLTYGGFVLSFTISAIQVMEALDCLLGYLRNNHLADNIVYRTIPYIYHRYPAQEDLYALFRFNARLIERKISSAILLDNLQPFRKLRKRQMKKGLNSGLRICIGDNPDYFWNVLEEVLETKHHTTPVHSKEEMKALLQYFPQNIHLYTVYSDDKVLAGCIVYETTEVAHLQYIAANEEGKCKGALDFLFHHLINDVYLTKRYFDFGVSVEQNGWFLNEGLQFQKEGFGARGIVYDTYEIQIADFNED